MNNQQFFVGDEGSHKQPSHYDLQWLNQSKKATDVTEATYSVKTGDDILLVSAASTITLPKARRGREISVVNTATSGTVSVVPAGSDTIIGTTSVLMTVRWTCLDFKAIDGGWIII